MSTPLRRCPDCGQYLHEGHTKSCNYNWQERAASMLLKASVNDIESNFPAVESEALDWPERYERLERELAAVKAALHRQDLRASAMEKMGRLRIAVEPEYEGDWLASLYGEDETSSFTARGPTPEEAVIAVVVAESGGV